MAPSVYRVFLALIFLLFGPSSIAADHHGLCSQISKEVLKAERHNRLPAFAWPADEVPLCYRMAGTCDKGDLEAEQLWEVGTSPEDAKAIEEELKWYSRYGGDVTHVRVAGRADPVLRIERHVGTARCIRDTYLEKHGSGYRLLENESLERLSQEGGYCNGSYVSYLDLRGKTYAALVEIWEDGRRLTMMQADANLNLTKVCAVKWSPQPRKFKR